MRLGAHARRRSVRVARGGFRAEVRTYLPQLLGNRRLWTARRAHLELWARALHNAPRDTVTAPQIQQILAAWAREGYAYWTLKHRRHALLAFYTALDADTDVANPVARTTIPVRKPEPEPRGLPIAVVRAILAAVSDQGGVIAKGDRTKPKGRRGGRRETSRARLLIHVMALTGMRPVEIEQFHARDWRRAAKELVIHGAKGSDERVVPVLEQAEPWLAALSRLPSPIRFNRNVIGRAFQRALVKVGLAPAPTRRRRRPRALGATPRPRTGLPRPYDLRHSFGTAAYAATEDLSTVQTLLGHKDIRQTQRYAKNAVGAVQRAAMVRVAAAWKG